MSDENLLAEIKALRNELRKTRSDSLSAIQRLEQSIHSQQALYNYLQTGAFLPPMGGWAMRPAAFTHLLGLVAALPQNTTILELGSGVSTVYLGLAAKQANRNIRVVSLDHDREYLERTSGHLAAHPASLPVELRHAPLVQYEIGGLPFHWYRDIPQPGPVSLMIVDGPPSRDEQLVRYPAYPALRHFLIPGAWVVLDDVGRTEEQQTLERWRSEFPLDFVDRGKYVGGAQFLQRAGKSDSEQPAS